MAQSYKMSLEVYLTQNRKKKGSLPSWFKQVIMIISESKPRFFCSARKAESFFEGDRTMPA